MNTDKSETPVESAAKKPVDIQLEQDHVTEVMDFLRENGVALVVGVLVAVVGFVGYSMWKSSQVAKVDAASSLLANAMTPPQFEEILANYPDTPAAPMARLSLASAYYDQGQYEMARDAFAQFASAHPAHLMAPNAALGVAQSLEALARYDEALAAYDSFLAANNGHYLVSSATFGKARVLEAKQDYAAAKSLYEEFIAANPDSEWIGRAETGLDFVKKQERAAQVP